jgi:uncharacterized protein (DUF1800 family)
MCIQGIKMAIVKFSFRVWWVLFSFIYVTYSQANNIPVAAGDHVLAVAGQPVKLTFKTLLSNDLDDDNDQLFVRIVDDWENGFAEVDWQTESITFTPENNTINTARFTYGVADQANSNDYTRMSFAEVSIEFRETTQQENNPIANTDNFTVSANTPLLISISELFANDYDPNGDALHLILVDDWIGGNLQFDLNKGTMVYTPESDFVSGSFTYAIADQPESNDFSTMGFGIVNIIKAASPPIPSEESDLGDAPYASDDHLTFGLVTPLVIETSHLKLNDGDPENMPIYVTYVDDATNGSVSLNRDSRTVMFVPKEGETTGSFIYGVSDDAQNNDFSRMGFAKVNLAFGDILSTNQLPTGVDDELIGLQNTPLNIPFSTLLENDTDSDSSQLFIAEITDVRHGQAALDTTNNIISFIPDEDFIGEASFSYFVSDLINDTELTRASLANVKITIEPHDLSTNQRPEARDDNFEGIQGEPISINVSDLLVNDTDPEDDTLYLLDLSESVNGVADLNLDSGVITFVPEAEASEASFNYGISDIQNTQDTDRIVYAQVTIRFISVQTPPDSTGAFGNQNSTNRFLTQTTFGPTKIDIQQLTGTSASEWFLAELNKPASLVLPIVDNFRAQVTDNPLLAFRADISYRFAFMKNAIAGDDQLRQRVAFALSQILVTSDRDVFLENRPRSLAAYQDLLINHALGNYRDLLGHVTYSPAMGAYLTYAGNRKGDPETGRTPDENYAREIMQLFTIGVSELDQNGEEIIDPSGRSIEAYSNRDVTGLARVFTGLYYATPNFGDPLQDPMIEITPMVRFDAFHSDLEKQFLGTVIPANTGAEESIDIALDTLVNHPNTAPFIGRQLIQRLVMSHPSADYVHRVATAFSIGQYELPNGVIVGDGRRGDLSATVASIIFDREARSEIDINRDSYGKVREPIVRVTHWARAFDAENVTPEFSIALWNTSQLLSQQAYNSPSVFNFFRPGYIAPGSSTGQAGINAPELQVTNASTVPGYANFIGFLIAQNLQTQSASDVGTEQQVQNTFRANYSQELDLAHSPAALIDALDNLLTAGAMSEETRSQIVRAIQNIPVEAENNGLTQRVYTAIYMVMTSPDYIVQR